MVAAAGEGSGLAPRVAIPVLAVAIAALIGSWLLDVRRSALEQIHPQYSPEVLSQKARDVVRDGGYTDAPADESYGFNWDQKFADYVQKHDKPNPKWNEILSQRPDMLEFWYRSSPYPLTALEFHDDLLTPGVVQPDDPPPLLSGMVTLLLDGEGRLKYLEAIPPQVQEPLKQTLPVDWKPLFSAAGLDMSQFQSAEPRWNWLASSDERAAWDGKWPQSERPLHVEAAALHGKAVAFRLIGPWTEPERMPPSESPRSEQIQLAILMVMTLVVIIGVSLLARGNEKRKRVGDAEGATRLGVWIGWVMMALWVCRSHLGASTGTFGMFLLAMATSIFYAFVVRTMYLTLEPYVRRRWPQTIISWTAVLKHRARDPVVGRDVLIGITIQVVLTVLGRLVEWLTLGPNQDPALRSTDGLLGIRATVATCLTAIPHGIREGLVFFFLLFILRLVLRNQWAAGVGVAALFATLTLLGFHWRRRAQRPPSHRFTKAIGCNSRST